jgi:hypothetical protein
VRIFVNHSVDDGVTLCQHMCWHNRASIARNPDSNELPKIVGGRVKKGGVWLSGLIPGFISHR